MEIAPGKPYISKYRIIIADGEPTKEQVETWWNEWAASK
jgi:hypothetical protein